MNNAHAKWLHVAKSGKKVFTDLPEIVYVRHFGLLSILLMFGGANMPPEQQYANTINIHRNAITNL